MAFNVCGRLSRFLRATIVPAAIVFMFSILLTFVFILYKPSFGPGDLQHVGWQAWEPISALTEGSHNVEVVDEKPPSATTDGEGLDVDWWNTTRPADSGVDTASLPLDVWTPLLQHDTGCVYYYILWPYRTSAYVHSI
jgi:hypothetical protein